jgi:hypothetical protein
LVRWVSWAGEQLATSFPSLRKCNWFAGIMDEDPQPDPEHKMMVAEQQRITAAVAQTTFGWAQLENKFVMLLAAIIRDPSASLASEIYFAASNFETRFAIVDRGLRLVCDGLPVIDDWDKVNTKLKNLKKTRNKIAHGHISTQMTPSGKNVVRLTPPLFKFREFGEAHQAKQLIGLSGADIEAHNQATYDLSNLVTGMLQHIPK